MPARVSRIDPDQAAVTSEHGRIPTGRAVKAEPRLSPLHGDDNARKVATDCYHTSYQSMDCV